MTINRHVLFVSAWQSGSVKTVCQPWSDYNGINRVEWCYSDWSLKFLSKQNFYVLCTSIYRTPIISSNGIITLKAIFTRSYFDFPVKGAYGNCYISVKGPIVTSQWKTQLLHPSERSRGNCYISVKGLIVTSQWKDHLLHPSERPYFDTLVRGPIDTSQ